MILLSMYYAYIYKMIHSQNIHHIHHNASIYNITYDVYIYIVDMLYTYIYICIYH